MANLFRAKEVPWDDIPGQFDEHGEWDTAGHDPGAPRVFSSRSLRWDEIPGNFDDQGTFDEAGGESAGRPKLFR